MKTKVKIEIVKCEQMGLFGSPTTVVQANVSVPQHIFTKDELREIKDEAKKAIKKASGNARRVQSEIHFKD